MASNDKRTLINRLSGTAGKGAGANTGLGTADVLIPEFPKLPSRITEETARQFRQDVDRWRVNLQGQFPIPLPDAFDSTDIEADIASGATRIAALEAKLSGLATTISNEVSSQIDNLSIDAIGDDFSAWRASVDSAIATINNTTIPAIQSQINQILARFPIDASDVTFQSATYTTVEQALNKLLYGPLEVTSFTGSVTSAELGSSVTPLVLTWTYSANVLSQSISNTGATLVPTARTYTYVTPITTNRTFTLIGNDGTANASASVTVSFYRKRYWGVSSSGALTDAQILGLSGNEFATSRETAKVIASVDQYIYVAYPASFGEAMINVNGLLNTAWVLTTRPHTNFYGYESQYHIYRSQYKLTGTYQIAIS